MYMRRSISAQSCLEIVEAALQVGDHVLAGAGPLDQHPEIGDAAAE
jgi:hypothetical protein